MIKILTFFFALLTLILSGCSSSIRDAQEMLDLDHAKKIEEQELKEEEEAQELLALEAALAEEEAALEEGLKEDNLQESPEEVEFAARNPFEIASTDKSIEEFCLETLDNTTDNIMLLVCKKVAQGCTRGRDTGSHIGILAEWLRRQTRNLVGSALVGSNPADVVVVAFGFFLQRRWHPSPTRVRAARPCHASIVQG